ITVAQLDLDSLPLLFSFFTATPPSEIYTLSLHDALPISWPTLHPIFSAISRSPTSTRSTKCSITRCKRSRWPSHWLRRRSQWLGDRKSTRLNSSHDQISYAVFCLKKKKKQQTTATIQQTH